MVHDDSETPHQHTGDELHLDLSESEKYAARINHSQASENEQRSQQGISASTSDEDVDQGTDLGTDLDTESQSITTSLLDKSKKDRYDGKVMYEFGGPWGVLLIMVLSHVILYYFFLGQDSSNKSALPDSWKDTVGR